MRLSSLIMLLVVLSVSISFAGLLMPPYLQALTPTSVYVIVECDSPDTVTVQYGADSLYGMSVRTESIGVTTATTYVNRILITGLSPNTLYHYSAGQMGVYSTDSHFTTGVLPGASFRFAWMADCRTGSLVYDSVMYHIALTNPLLALYGGDLCADPTYSTWKNEFFRPGQAAFDAVVPWVSATGNHEGWNTNTQAFTCAPPASVAQDHFAFDCGDLHVLVLDSEYPLTIGTAQYAFADSDLAGTGQTWKLVMLHKPAYCSGGHGEDAGVKALTSGVFEKRGVDLVIAGHSHFYQHNFVNGIHHMVIGSAGAPLHVPTNASYTVKSVMQHNWARCEVTPTSLSLFVFNEHGVPLDTVVLSKGGTGVAPSAARFPREAILAQSYPNPFNPTTEIGYRVEGIGERVWVTLKVYDILGRDVATLVNEVKQTGTYTVRFDGSGLAGGVYICRLTATTQGGISITDAKKMVLMK